MFKKFKISDVFYKINTPKIKAKANDFPTEYSEEYCVPLLTAGAENQGLNRYAKTSDCSMIINNAISVSANGVNSGICFYQPHDFAVLQDAYAVKVNGRGIDGVEEGLYLTGALNKAVRDNHDWVNKAGWNRIKDDSIELPVIENPSSDHKYAVDDIDWQYMHDYITELEHDRITELDAYLQATGLNDYELTEDDKKVLSQKVEYDSFQINEVFEPLKVGFIGKGQKIGSATKEPDDVHCVPLTCAKIGDNGIMYWGKKGDFITYKNTLAVIADGAVSAGLVYAQPEEAGAYSHSYFIDTKEKDVSKYAKQYLSSVLTKVIYPKYSREDAPRWNKIETEMIYLPIKSDGTPDFDYMERYIRAIEKVVIADVVKYKDKVIEETRKVVGA
jgi:hypothetical protein